MSQHEDAVQGVVQEVGARQQQELLSEGEEEGIKRRSLSTLFIIAGCRPHVQSIERRVIMAGHTRKSRNQTFIIPMGSLVFCTDNLYITLSLSLSLYMYNTFQFFLFYLEFICYCCSFQALHMGPASRNGG